MSIHSTGKHSYNVAPIEKIASNVVTTSLCVSCECYMRTLPKVIRKSLYQRENGSSFFIKNLCLNKEF